MGEDGGLVEKEDGTGLECGRRKIGVAHHLQGLQTKDGDVEAVVLLGFSSLYKERVLSPEGACPGEHGIRALEGFHG